MPLPIALLRSDEILEATRDQDEYGECKRSVLEDLLP